ncbi:toxin-activating lysine-acyltransferase [Vibrio penaeicida]|uniref:RTX toxin-activating lysine-acyltransferase n=1 Tax=Vibrio penaeicida TaxID=104609 RepID=A0AAV5P030_9VIBR|nr:toxin-activating lysine-acyltransferase [Vibrio penaeicida]RTZ21694.1 toxin-activating lysine-acyltransferase [Vibrio penaeicida]GLQ75919.1 hypothetical protein GCM10007932_52820 [Vibrio penaeicida]
MLVSIPPVLNEPLSYQRTLGVCALIFTLDGSSDYSLGKLYEILSRATENEDVEITYSNEGRPQSFKVFACGEVLEHFEVNPSSDWSRLINPLRVHIDNDFYRALGNFFELMACSDLHHNYQAAEYISVCVIPPICNAYFHIFYDSNDFPFGVVSWARMSEKRHSAISNEFQQLEQADWCSGERLFVFDMIAPWGGVSQMCKYLLNEVFLLDSVALADRVKVGGNERKAAFRGSNFQKRKMLRKLEKLNSISELSLHQAQEIHSDLSDTLRKYELRLLLDRNDTQTRETYTLMATQSEQVMSRCSSLLTSHAQLPSKHQEQSIDMDLLLGLSRLAKDYSVDYVDYELEQVFLPFSYFEVIDMMNDAWTKILVGGDQPPSNSFDLSSLNKRVYVDPRALSDSIDRPFCKYMGRKQPIYVYSPYNASVPTALTLAHEYSHAIHFEMNSLESEGLIEDRPIIKEFLALTGELLLTQYLIDNNYVKGVRGDSIVESCSKYLSDYKEQLAQYSDSSKVSYSTNYPLALYLANVFLSDKVTNEQRRVFASSLLKEGKNYDFNQFVNFFLNIERESKRAHQLESECVV